MPIRETSVVTRPNTSTPWFEMSDTFKEYLRKNYDATGKRNLKEKFISENKLQKTTVIDFKDTASKYEYANDSTLHAFRNERDLHYITNGMTMKRSSETV